MGFPVSGGPFVAYPQQNLVPAGPDHRCVRTRFSRRAIVGARVLHLGDDSGFVAVPGGKITKCEGSPYDYMRPSWPRNSVWSK
jgi:hypothetical protein